MDNKGMQLDFSDFCFDHFQHNDDPKGEQYKTPQGSKDTSPNGNDSESIEVVETPSNTYRGPLQESTISSASTNNTDIFVLDLNLSNDDLQFLPNQEDGNPISDDSKHDVFIESEEGDEVFLRAVDVLDKNEDFTILHKPTKTLSVCSCEESTEVLMLINSEYQDKRINTYSGTDSDVEVLMSEEVIESDWSSGNGLEDDSPKSTPLVEKNYENVKNDFPLPEEEPNSGNGQSCKCNSLKTQASTTDFDISDEEIRDNSFTNDKYQNLNRTQLLQIIQKQELCIQALEATVERYQKAQQRLFEHVDALRVELSEIRISPLTNFEQVKNV